MINLKKMLGSRRGDEKPMSMIAEIALILIVLALLIAVAVLISMKVRGG